MANRFTTQFRESLTKRVTDVFAHITFGASGAPTLDTAVSKGVVSVTRNSAGKYTLVFGTKAGMLDVYNKLLMVSHVFDASGNSGTAPASPSMFILANNVSNPALCSLQIEFNLAGTATDPASGEGVYLEITLRNSSV